MSPVVNIGVSSSPQCGHVGLLLILTFLLFFHLHRLKFGVVPSGWGLGEVMLFGRMLWVANACFMRQKENGFFGTSRCRHTICSHGAIVVMNISNAFRHGHVTPINIFQLFTNSFEVFIHEELLSCSFYE